MTSSGQERRPMKIRRDVITHLEQPRQEAIHLLETEYDVLATSDDAVPRSLILDIYRHLISAGGDAQTLSIQRLTEQLSPKYTASQVSSSVDHLISRGIVIADNHQVRLSSGVLAKLLHSKIQAETAGIQKAEAFIANRYEYYLEKGQLLSEEDINYISPFVADLVLREEHRNFIEKSRATIQKEKRRSARTIAIVIALLSLLSAAAIFFATRSGIQAKKALEQTQIAKRQTEIAIEQQRLAIQRAEEARRAEEDARNSARIARDAEREAQLSNLKLEEANKQIRQLLNDEQKARKFAEEQESVATERALEIEKLNKDLSQYAEDKEREARAAQDARAEADSARQISDDLRSVLLSRIVAQRSLAMKESDGDLKAYTAMLAYHINSTVDYGDTRNPDVYRAVYYAARNQRRNLIPEAKDLANGTVGSLSFTDPRQCVMGASDGTIIQFTMDPATGRMTAHNSLFQLPHDAVRFVFPHGANSSVQTAFVMGAFDHIIEIDLPHGNAPSRELRRISLPGRQFVKYATRTSVDELMIQTIDGAIYAFNCKEGTLQEIIPASEGALAWTVIPHLGLLCFANASNALILTDRKRDAQVDYVRAKKQVALMEARQYGNTIYLAIGYTDGELEVFISNQDAFLSGYQGQLQGKSYYEIQSLRSSVHKGFISSMAFAESRPLLAVSSYDRSVTVWDLESWAVRRGDYQPIIMDDHDDWVTVCAFVPGDEALISGSKLGTIKFWSLDPETFARGLCNTIIGEPNDEEWTEYIGEELRKYREYVCR